MGRTSRRRGTPKAPEIRELEKQSTVIPDPLDFRDYEYSSPLVSLPPEYPMFLTEVLPRYGPLVRDQETNGPCTGYALAAMINYLKWSRGWRAKFLVESYEEGKTPENLTIPSADTVEAVSPEMLYHVARFYDNEAGEEYEKGSSVRGVLRGWRRHGVCLEEHWGKLGAGEQPHPDWRSSAAQCTIGAFYRVYKKDQIGLRSFSRIQSAIYETGAVLASASISVPDWAALNHNGRQPREVPTLRTPSTGPHAGHAFAIVGYTETGFVILNSWGRKFGYHGFAIMPYDEWQTHGADVWVAALGVPISRSLDIMRGGSRKGATDFVAGNGREELAGSVARKRAFGVPDQIVASQRDAWSEEKAYLHSVVISDRGTPLNRLIERRNGTEAVKYICGSRMIDAFENDHRLTQIALYAHSGLEPESISMRRAAVLAPYFYENGVYPIFISGQSGFMEPLGQMLLSGVQTHQSMLGQKMDKAIHGVLEAWKQPLGAESEARDAQLERVCTKLIRPLWTQFKRDAEVAAEPDGALYTMAEVLAEALQHKVMKDVKPGIHLIAHSAGAIQIGEFVRKMNRGSKGLKAASCALFAPACSMEFATETFGEAGKKGTIPVSRDNVHIEILSDENERADNVADIYGKSFLYLLSRALEDRKYTPVLGMETAWATDEASQLKEFTSYGANEIKAWQKTKFGKVAPNVHSKPQIKVCSKGEYQQAAHDLFDNNVVLLTDTIKRIAGRDRLNPKVGTLKGF